MFSQMMNWVRRVINKLFNKSKTNININVTDKMATAIDRWTAMYEDRAPWLDAKSGVYSLGLASEISGELARMTTIEMKSEITGSVRANYLNDIYKNFLKKIRTYCEYGVGKGGIIFKPYVNGNKISINTIQADKFYPVSFDSDGNLISVIFIAQKSIGDTIYTRLEYHALTEKGYYISNHAFKSNVENDLGKEISLTEIEEWSEIQTETLIQNIDKPLFGYFKTPFANTIDTDSPLGVACFAKAEKLIQKADEQYSRLLWEYEAGEMAIDADMSAIQENEIASEQFGMPKLKERLFRALDIQKDGKGMYEVFAPQLRDASFIKGLNVLLIKIEDKCGFARGTLSIAGLNEGSQAGEKTAKEIISTKQKTYSTVSDTQKALQTALENLIYAMDVLCTLYQLSPKGKFEASFEWDDSIIVDTESEQVIRMQEVRDGIEDAVGYRMWRYGETLEQATKKINAIEEKKKADKPKLPFEE